MSKMLSRSPRATPDAVADVRDDVAALLAEHSREAGQFSVLGPDPWFVLWNDDRSGYVAFLEGRRVIVSWRSPVATPDEQPGLLARLASYAAGAGKTLVALEVNAVTREAGVALGMPVLWTGSESVVDLAGWSIAGGRRQKLRWARNHARSIGVRWREAFPTTSRADWDEFARIQEAWKSVRPERRTNSFLRTDFAELAPYRRYFASEGPEGVNAFVTCAPVSSSGWYLQDLVREPEAPRGSLEGALALALDTFRDEGYAFASNGPLPFWHPDDGFADLHELGALGRRVFRFFDRQYRFSAINQFRSKIEPDVIEPLYVLRSHRIVTPGVARALQRMLGDGDVRP